MTIDLETTLVTITAPLLLTQLWGMIVSYPRLLTRVEALEQRRLEDRKITDTLASGVEALSLASARAQFELTSLHTQFAEDRALTREMHKDWQKSQKDLGQAVVKLETTLDLINRTLRNNNRDVE